MEHSDIFLQVLNGFISDLDPPFFIAFASNKDAGYLESIEMSHKRMLINSLTRTAVSYRIINIALSLTPNLVFGGAESIAASASSDSIGFSFLIVLHGDI